MLRKLLLTTLVIVSGFMTSASAFAVTEDEEHVMPASDDRWVPWPWKLAQPFPWSEIHGLWKVEQGDFTSYFALKVVRAKGTGLRQLSVKQFDGETCRVLATGVGIEKSLKVLAQMTSKAGQIYRVELTAFSEKDAPPLPPPLPGNIPTEGVMVLSMGTLESRGPEEMVHMRIMKISPYLTQKTCVEDSKR